MDDLLRRVMSADRCSWLSALPDTVGGGGLASKSEHAVEDGAEDGDALHRCLCREVATGASLLSKVRSDLTAVARLCRGESKATNEVGKRRRGMGTQSTNEAT